MVEPAPKLEGVLVLETCRIGTLPGTLGKLFPAEIVLLPEREITEIELVPAPALVAVPPVLPGIVAPLVVPAGCPDSVIV